MDHTVIPANTCLYLVSVHGSPDGVTTDCSGRHLVKAYYSVINIMLRSKRRLTGDARDVFREKLFEEFSRSVLSPSARSKWTTGSRFFVD